MKTKHLVSIISILFFSTAQAGDFKFACSDALVEGSTPKLIIVGSSVQKFTHYKVTATAQINGQPNITLIDSNEAGASAGALLYDAQRERRVILNFDVTFSNNLLQYNNDGFTLNHAVIPADGKINSVATVVELSGNKPLDGLSNINMSCLVSATSTPGSGFRSFLSGLANGVGDVVVCAAFPQDCEN